MIGVMSYKDKLIAFNLYQSTGRVEFYNYAIVNYDTMEYIYFKTLEGAQSILDTGKYQGYSIEKLGLPESDIMEAISCRTFVDVDDVEEFIKTGYKDSILYKVKKIESEITGIKDTTEMSIDEYKAYKQEQNKTALSNYLKNNPLKWTDGEYYGVTQEDQIEMQTDLQAYNLKKSTGDTNWKLEWHNTKHGCKPFTEQEFYTLMSAIVDFVYPLRKVQESYKEQIYACTTKEEIDKIDLVYGSPNETSTKFVDETNTTEEE